MHIQKSAGLWTGMMWVLAHLLVGCPSQAPVAGAVIAEGSSDAELEGQDSASENVLVSGTDEDISKDER